MTYPQMNTIDVMKQVLACMLQVRAPTPEFTEALDALDAAIAREEAQTSEPFAYFHRDPNKNPKYQQVMAGAAGHIGVVAAYARPAPAPQADAQQVAVPQGWKLTQEMLEAVWQHKKINDQIDDTYEGVVKCSFAVEFTVANLAAVPQPSQADARVPMTLDEIDDMWEGLEFQAPIYLVRAVEAHHGIKPAGNGVKMVSDKIGLD